MTRRDCLHAAAMLALALSGQEALAHAGTQTWPPPGAGAKEVPPRMPRYPLKTARTLRTDAEIAQARANVARYPSARKVADAILKGADAWLAWEDADIVRLITPASVPRAFDVGASVGCPKCGLTIHEKFGSYPWLVDLKKPFQLTCPVDGSVYPSNDYAAYLESGFQEKRGWDTAYVDDGWGWKNPENNERYWFVAHYNHRVWHYHIGPGVGTLARAYQLTGDTRYAHKAAVMLHRIAEVYPAMDHERQSRYGLLSAAQGRRYPGKVLNLIWETNLALGFAEAYDAVWETIDGDAALQKAAGKDGRALRAAIEANILEEAIDAYYAEKIRGNFGMHQSALAHLALARQHGEQAKWIGGLLGNTGASTAHTGLNYALYNLVFRDGVPSESAPGYNFLWVSKITDLAALLAKSDHDLFALPRTRRLYEGVLDVINARRFTPSLGDSGSVYGDTTGKSADVFQAAYRAYGDDRYARFLASFGAAGDGGFQTFDALFLPPVAAAEAALPPQRARLLDGCGLGILSDPGDTVSATLTYGFKAGHGHFDRLSFELFAAGQPLMPDLGYPDAMNDYVAGIYTWSKNTISHNTVTVDASRQPANVVGTVRLFADSDFARVLDVDAAGTYPQASAYRRALLMVDTGDGQGSYYLDVFDVAGGSQHDYSLHGPPGAFLLHGGDWTDPAPGTLAGEKVAVGEFYDNAEMGRAGYDKGYSRYAGSGFQHLSHVRRHTGGDWTAEWRHEKDAEARLRIRTLPQPGQQMLLAQARVSPVKNPQILHYLIARRTGKEIASRFVSVIEPYRKDPFIASVTPHALAAGSGVAVAVRRASGETDLLLYDPTGSEKRLADLATDAHAAVVTRDAAGRVRRVFFAGGGFLRVGKEEYRAKPLKGQVIAVQPSKHTLRVRLDAGGDADTASLAGRVVHFENDLRRTAHPVAGATRDGAMLTLTTRDDLLIGRAPVKQVKEATVTVDTSLPLALLYRGAAASGGDFTAFHPVASATGTTITLRAPLPQDSPIRAGADVWLVNVAPGDRFEAPAIFARARE